MKKFTKVMALAMVCVLALFALTACGVSQKTADKINDAAKNKEHWTYDKCKKQLGDPTIDVSGSSSLLDVTGVVTWVSGCKTYDDAKAKLDAGKTLNALTVTFVNGKATGASFGEWKGEKK